jgi:hypothetical protein
MCFSSTASFGAGILLSAIGIASVRKVRMPEQIMFASIPLLFSFQQISEGFLWLALTDPAYTGFEKGATYFFLAFAQVIWPFWVPVALFLLEKERKQKTILGILVFIGLLVAIFRFYWISVYTVQAVLTDNHIAYEFNHTNPLLYYGSIIYFAATVIPFFASTVNKMWTLGTLIVISFIFSRIFYSETFISIWCFFAAIISIVVLGIMKELQLSTLKENIPAAIKPEALT